MRIIHNQLFNQNILPLIMLRKWDIGVLEKKFEKYLPFPYRENLKNILKNTLPLLHSHGVFPVLSVTQYCPEKERIPSQDDLIKYSYHHKCIDFLYSYSI